MQGFKIVCFDLFLKSYAKVLDRLQTGPNFSIQKYSLDMVLQYVNCRYTKWMITSSWHIKRTNLIFCKKEVRDSKYNS